MLLFIFYSNLLVRAAQGPFIRMYPQQVSMTSRPKRERQFFLSLIRLSQARSRKAAADHAMSGANFEPRVPNMAANVLNPLRRHQWRGLIRTPPTHPSRCDVLIRKKKNRTRERTDTADRRCGSRARSARPCARARYANALMREDRRESLRATVLRFITPTRALR